MDSVHFVADSYGFYCAFEFCILKFIKKKVNLGAAPHLKQTTY